MATWLEEATGFLGVDTALRDLGAWVVSGLPGGASGATAQGLVRRAETIVQAEKRGEDTTLATLGLLAGGTALGVVGAPVAGGREVARLLDTKTLILLMLAGAAALYIISR